MRGWSVQVAHGCYSAERGVEQYDRTWWREGLDSFAAAMDAAEKAMDYYEHEERNRYAATPAVLVGVYSPAGTEAVVWIWQEHNNWSRA